MTSAVTRLAAVALLLLVAPLSAETQPAGKVHRIGFLSSGSSKAPSPVHEGFRQGLRELGRVEGQNIVIGYRFADGHDRLPALAAELVRLKVDIIVALATPATAAAKNATVTIPIVMIGAGDPVGSGFIASLARPGGNVTGLTYSGTGMDILAKQLKLLMEAVPKVSRVAILSNQTNAAHPVWMKEIKAAGRSLGVKLQFLEVGGPNEFDRAFAAMAKDQGHSSKSQTTCSYSTEHDSQHSRRRPVSLRSANTGNSWRPGASCRMGRTCLISGGAPPFTRTKSSRVPSPPTCPSSSMFAPVDAGRVQI